MTKLTPAQIRTLQADLRAANDEVKDVMSQNARLRERIDTIADTVRRQPVPMFLTCPGCGARHIDKGEFATKPHHTHACQNCGMCWRPAVVATVGVKFLPGFKDDAEAVQRVTGRILAALDAIKD